MKFVKNTWLPDSDTHFENIINDEGNYQKEQFDAVLKYIKPEDRNLFIDVGAHVGLWTRMAIKAGFQHFLCFEPDIQNLYCLKRNLRNSLEHFTNKNDTEIETTLERCVCMGLLGDKLLKHISLVKETHNNSGSITMKIDPNGNKFIVPFDGTFFEELRLMPQNFKSLIKIDVQGHEAKVVRGMTRFIKKNKPIIIVEQWLDGKEDLEATNYCKSLGMKILETVKKEVILGW